MSRWYSYLNTAIQIISHYTGKQPFALYLKGFYSKDKKYGSKDRKQISHLCYCYFRLGHACKNLPIEERLLTGLFLCSSESHSLLEQLRPQWNESVNASLEEKLVIARVLPQEIFPWNAELSEGIEPQVFAISFFTQPDLFVRIRPGKNTAVIDKLIQSGVSYTLVTDSCIALPNASKIETIVTINKEVVIQDYSSQRIREFYSLIENDQGKKGGLRVWDCCAASGGKSILAKDIFSSIDLTVSDIRPSILHNLKARFNEAGIHSYESFTADLSTHKEYVLPSSFDLVICDAPCSGSGTWGRTPEELFYFHENEIEKFSLLQKKIITNIIPAVKPGGYLLYITCSVFKNENEEVANHCASLGLQLVKKEVLTGYEKKADTMFAALFQKLL